MSSRGSFDREKMPATRGQERLIRPGDSAVESERGRYHRQSTTQPIVSIQPSPPVQTTPEAFTMISTLGYVPSHVSKGESSHQHSQKPQTGKLVPRQPQVKEEVLEEHKPSQDQGPYKLDTDGKVIIRPYARGWTPSLVAVDAIKSVIQTQFQGAFHCWSQTPRDVREYWWKLFKEKVSWDPRNHGYIKKMFQQRGAKCLSDMLTKVRKKGTRPNWIREEAWTGLIAHWEGQALKVSTQNKTNCVFGKGEAVHTIGHKAHFDMALRMAPELERFVNPDELFLATHTEGSDDWVDGRSQATYTKNHDHLSELQTQIGETSTNGPEEVDGVTKLDFSKEVVGCMTQGQCYGTMDLSSNLRRGASLLTQESRAPSGANSKSEQATENATVLQEVIAAQQDIIDANQKLIASNQRIAKENQLYQHLEEQFRTMMDRMAALECQFTGASTSVSQAHQGHPHHDEAPLVMKLDLSKEVVGGKTRGQCYSTTDLSLSLQSGASLLVQECQTPFGTNGRSEQATENSTVQQDLIATHQRLIAANDRLVEANQQYQHLEEQFRTMMDRMAALERQSAGASTSASQAHQGHPHHDEASRRRRL